MSPRRRGALAQTIRSAPAEAAQNAMNIDEHSRRQLPATEERYMTVPIAELPTEGMLLAGVALAGDAYRVTKTGLSLLFTASGITVHATEPPGESLLAWGGLDGAWCREQVALTDGRTAAVLELSSSGQTIQFLLPSDTVAPGQVAYLEQAVPAWLARYKGPVPPESIPTPPTPGISSDPGGGAWGAAAGPVGTAVAAGTFAATNGWSAAPEPFNSAPPAPASPPPAQPAPAPARARRRPLPRPCSPRPSRPRLNGR